MVGWHLNSIKSKTWPLVVLLTLPLLSTSFITPVQAFQTSQEILFSNMVVRAELGQNCTTTLSIQTNVTNIGSVDLEYIDLRIDIRALNLIQSSVDEVPANADFIEGDRFLISRVDLHSPLSPGSSVDISMVMTTDQLQERMTQDMTGVLCINHFIFYLRPLNEIQDLTVMVLLPPHANLESGASAPLFPNPSANFTDGSRLGFTWLTPFLFPGQELAFIVKYQLPSGLLQQDQVAEPNLLLIILLAASIGVIAALVLERTPAAIRKLRSTREPKISVVSRQEDQVLALLKKKGGSCLQREIYEDLDLSQSAASMILNSLEERGLIKRFRDGRENVVHIIE